MYDFLLRGKDNYPADRAACEALLDVTPNAAALVKAQRAFSLAAVNYLAVQHGVRQFLDFGCGLPTWVNTHQVAQQARRDSCVVYIDKDPMVVAHGRVLLDGDGSTAVVQGDLLEGDSLLDRPQVDELIDLDQPVAFLMASVLHCVHDDELPAAAVRSLLGRLASGSFLVLSQWVSENPDTRQRVAQVMHRSTAGAWGQVRTMAEVEGFFNGLALEDPGLTDISAWVREGRTAAEQLTGMFEYGGVGRIQR